MKKTLRQLVYVAKVITEGILDWICEHLFELAIIALLIWILLEGYKAWL